MFLFDSLNFLVWSRMISSPCGSLAGEKNVTFTGWPVAGLAASDPPPPVAPQAAARTPDAPAATAIAPARRMPRRLVRFATSTICAACTAATPFLSARLVRRTVMRHARTLPGANAPASYRHAAEKGKESLAQTQRRVFGRDGRKRSRRPWTGRAGGLLGEVARSWQSAGP